MYFFCRLTPAVAAMIIVHVTILKFIGHGPHWPPIEASLVSPCANNWWATLLYVHNYVSGGGMVGENIILKLH